MEKYVIIGLINKMYYTVDKDGKESFQWEILKAKRFSSLNSAKIRAEFLIPRYTRYPIHDLDYGEVLSIIPVYFPIDKS